MAIKTVYDYKTAIRCGRDLEPYLNEHGENGWHLHTCDYLENRGDFMVVMYRMHMIDDGQDPYEEEKPSEGLAMRG